MSATIYLKSSGDDPLSSEQAELYFKYHDQALVWSRTIFKEAARYKTEKDFVKLTEEEIAQRGEVLAEGKKRLEELKGKKEKGLSEEELRNTEKEIILLETNIRNLEYLIKHDIRFKPIQKKIDEWGNVVEVKEVPAFDVPTDEEMKIFTDPTPFGGGKQNWMEYARSLAKNKFFVSEDPKGILDVQETYIDPDTKQPMIPSEKMRKTFSPLYDEFANECLLRAIRTYDPARGAQFRTHLWNVMRNAASTTRKKWLKHHEKMQEGVSISEPLGGEDGDESITREEILPESLGKEPGLIDVLLSHEEEMKKKFTSLPEPRPGKEGKMPSSQPAYGNALFSILMDYVQGFSLEDIAKDLGYTSIDLSKEEELMKELGIAPSEAFKGEPGANMLIRKQREMEWKKFFKGIDDKLADPSISQDEKDNLEEKKETAERRRQEVATATPYLNRVRDFLRIIEKTLREIPEIEELIDEGLLPFERESAIENLLETVSEIKKTAEVHYSLLKEKIQQKLSEVNPQLFVVYTNLYDIGLSNPETARTMKLSPPRITGLKKKIIATLSKLPEIQNIIEETNGSSSTSSLRRFLYWEGDRVKISSINKIGTIIRVSGKSFEIKIDSDITIFTTKNDLQRYSTLEESTLSMIKDYFKHKVLATQCYLSLVSSKEQSPKLVIVELRPSSEKDISARLYVNSELVDLANIKEDNYKNLIAILKGHLGVDVELDPPFTSLFEEIR